MSVRKAPNGVLLATLLAMTSLSGLAAETWFLQGRWDYYALCDASYRPFFRTASNVIEVYRDLGDGRVIIHSTAYMIDSRRGATIPVSPPEGREYLCRSWYPGDEAKDKALDELARSILGGETTVEGAVGKLSTWVRNEVSYRLGVSTDPLEVARSGRAFCTGYANLMVALLRSVGIPAAVESCYIAPGNDWGFGGGGGNHAFVEYYYPGIGWLCHDPQSTSGYVDPFHLVDFSGTVYAQYRQAPDAYVTDYAEEPAAWSTYSAAGAAGARRGFALRVDDRSGKPVAFTASLAAARLSLEPSGDYFTRNVFGKPWCSAGGGQRVGLRADATRGVATMCGTDGWRSYFALPGAVPDCGEDMVVLKAAGLLGLRAVDLAKERFVVAAMDFSEGEAQCFTIRDPATGRALPSQRVLVTTGAIREELATGADGTLQVRYSGPEDRRPGELRISWGNAEYAVAFRPGTAMPVPDQSRQEAELQAALAAARSASPSTQFRLVVRDRAGTADATLVRAASLFDGPVEKRLSSRGANFLSVDGLEIGKSYVLRAYVRGVNVQRPIGPIQPGHGADLEICEADLRPTRLERPNPFDASKPTMYEYFADKASPWPLTGDGGEVRWDCPPGDYLVSDNAARTGVMRMRVEAGARLEYDPSSMDLEGYRFAEAFRLKTDDIAVGLARDEEGPLRSSPILVMDANGLTYYTVKSNEYGFFTFPALRPSTAYRMALAGPGRLVLRSFATDLRGRADTCFLVSGKGEKCHTALQWARSKPVSVYIFMSSTAKGEAVAQPIALATGADFELHADDGSYLLSTERTIAGATVISGGTIDGRRDRQGELCLCPDPADAGYLARSRAAARQAWPDATNALLIRFRDGEADGWKSACLEVRLGDRVFRPAFDSQGFIMLGAAKKAEYRFTYARAGVRWEGCFVPQGAGPEIMELSPDEARTVTLELPAGQGAALLGPSVKNGKLALGDKALTPDSRGRMRIVNAGPGSWLRLKDGRICFCVNQRAAHRLASIAMPDQAAAWKILLGECDAAGTDRVIDARALGLTPQATLRLGDGNGRTFPCWSPSSGIYLATGLTGQNLVLDINQNGLFVRQSWNLKGAGTEVLTVRAPQTANVALALSGPAPKIANAIVILYSGGNLEGGAVKGYAERIALRTSAGGGLAILVPNGTWYVEAGGQTRKVVVKAQEKQQVGIAMK